MYLGITRGRKDTVRSLPSLVNWESYLTRAGLSLKVNIRRVWGHLPPKLRVVPVYFISARVENELQELPCYAASEKI